MAAGTREPDTALDVAGGRMWSNPDSSPYGSGRFAIYFDVFPSEALTTVNANAGALGSRLQLAPNLQFQALLGVWKDCNGDGYVGLAESAVMEYRAELLLAGSAACPPGERAPFTFNDGTWIREFLPLAQPDPCVWTQPAPGYCQAASGFQLDPHVIYVNGTYVWGDEGKPGAPLDSSQCPVAPLPRGTTAGTGYLLDDLDCADGHAIVTTFDAADQKVDPSNGAQLQFQDPRAPERSTSRLNVHFPIDLYGDPSTGKAGLLQQDANDDAIRVFDCAPGTQPELDQLQPDPFHPTPTRATNASVHDPTGSYWDSAVAFDEAVQGDCDPSDGDALRDNYGFVALEGSATQLDAAEARNRPSYTFVFQDRSAASGVSLPPGVVGLPDAPPGAGTLWTRNLTGPLWTSTSWSVAAGPLLARANLSDPLAGASYQTFYAMVPPDVLADDGLVAPRMDVGTYGAEACGSATRGIVNGWDCDPRDWWKTKDGTDERPYYEGGAQNGAPPLGQVVGAPYLLRDVDCEDGRVTTWPAPGLPGDGPYASLAPESSSGTCS